MRSSSEWNEITARRPPGAQHAIGLVEAARQRLELVVDDDAQRLEDAARRIAGAEARRRGDVGLDDLDELAGRLDAARAHGARDDAAGDVLGVALLAVAAEDVGQLVGRQRR